MKKQPIALLMITAVTIISLSAIILFLNKPIFAVASAPPDPVTAEIKLIKGDANGLQFNLQTPAFQVSGSGKNIDIPGLDSRISKPGAPNLPYFATYIAIPPEAEVTVQVTESDLLHESLSTIEPVVGREFDLADNGTVIGMPREFMAEDREIYGRNALYPASLYSLSEPMYYRDMRLVALQLYPVRYNPVSGELQQFRNLEVQVAIDGGRFTDLRPLSPASSKHQTDFTNLILNYEQAQAWRSLPEHVLNAPETALPIGTDTYKIAVNEDGIYDVCQAELAAAGMNVNNVNPNTIQMLYRGTDIAYQFIGDSDNNFESGECVRFYGWKFAGTRSEKNFITENIYWLWAGGSRTTIAAASNQTSGGLKTSVWYTETREPELEDAYFTRADLNDWATFPNEPDIWYWNRIASNVNSRVYTMTIKEPDTASATATFLAEFIDRQNIDTLFYSVTATINNPSAVVSGSWQGHKNVNITDTIPPSSLINGENTITLTFDLDQVIYLNRFTVEYMRHLIADNDQLIFTDETGGGRLQVSGFSNNNAIVWNITNPAMPTRISNPSASGGVYTFGLNHGAGTKFIATTVGNVNTVSSTNIERYVPPNINPAGNDADWVAITHGDFWAQANTLAQHRASVQFGNLDTHVVNIEDVINQYGYGLPLPEAIRAYLTYALGNWATAPTYVTLIGDATFNPRKINCSCFGYDNLVPTDLVFVDRFNGMVPSDHTLVMLTGNDVLADMFIGRISVNTTLTANPTIQATTAVNKIIQYETNIQTTPVQSGSPFLFVADNDDSGGFFCDENILTAAHIPTGLGRDHICLGTFSYPDVDSVREEMFAQIASGLFILNFRGHGSINIWSGNGGGILTTSDIVEWQNTNKPAFILSADCLDGFFAYPGQDSISEIYLRTDNNGAKTGSSGMWSSTGLGYTFEHTVLHQGFYDGLFVANGRTAGEAINYSKMQYNSLGYHDSEMYTFALQGDPAMLMDFADSFVYLPAILRQ